MRNKQLTIRLTNDFHKALVEYCDTNMIPVSTFIVQQTAKAIGYKPRPATSRSVSSPPVEPQYWDGTKYISSPKPQAEEHYTEITMDEFTDMDFDLEALQRRAAAAPIKPV